MIFIGCSIAQHDEITCSIASYCARLFELGSNWIEPIICSIVDSIRSKVKTLNQVRIGFKLDSTKHNCSLSNTCTHLHTHHHCIIQSRRFFCFKLKTWTGKYSHSLFLSTPLLIGFGWIGFESGSNWIGIGFELDRNWDQIGLKSGSAFRFY